eukprot:1161654-Pelagomonas_calceolata.AAC.1
MVGGGQLAQPHPSCSCLAEDEDGLLPEWIVYHELVATTRPYLRQKKRLGQRGRSCHLNGDQTQGEDHPTRYLDSAAVIFKKALFFHGGFWGWGIGRAAVKDGRRRVRASRSMASNPPDPH